MKVYLNKNSVTYPEATDENLNDRGTGLSGCCSLSKADVWKWCNVLKKWCFEKESYVYVSSKGTSTCKRRSSGFEFPRIPAALQLQYPNNERANDKQEDTFNFVLSVLLMKDGTLTCQVAGILNSNRSWGTSISLYSLNRSCTLEKSINIIHRSRDLKDIYSLVC